MQYCELHFTGREYTVFIRLAIIQEFQKEISRAFIGRRPTELSGLLLGRGNDGAAIIAGYAPQPGPEFVRDKDRFWEQFAPSLQKRDDQLEILGYYRLGSGAEPVPEERDLRVMREFLPESAPILFLVGTSQETNIGSLFIWGEKDRQQLLTSKTKVRFPNPLNTKAATSEVIDSAGTSDPDMVRRMPPAAARISWRSPLVWTLAICIAAFPLWRMISTRQSHPQSSQKSSAQLKPAPLSVAGKIENGRLRVTWDAASPLLVSALSAVLSVNPEHGTPETQVLDRNQLMAGSTFFQLPPGHARIRLVVFTEEISELAPRLNPARDSQPIVPIATLSQPPDPVASSKETRLFQAPKTRTNFASPAKPPTTKRRERDVERMTVGFTDESWRDRFDQAQAEGASGSMQISRNRVPARPIHLIQPDRYYSLYPFTLDSVKIDVRVKINTSGEVTSAEPLSWGNALLNHLSTVAIRAARGSTFVPARFGDRNVASTAVLTYPFVRKR